MASPYNPENRLLTRDDVLAILYCQRAGHEPRAQELQSRAQGLQDLAPVHLGVYQRAFVHKGYCARNHEQWLRTHPPQRNVVPLQPESNTKLEWLGDSVLQLMVTDLLLERHPELHENVAVGRLASMRSGIVSNGALGCLMLRMGWYTHVLLDANLERMGGRTNTELLANCMEALVGAVYTDLGHAACRRWVAALLGDRLGPVPPGAAATGVEPPVAAAGPAAAATPAAAGAAGAAQELEDEEITYDAVVNMFSDGAKLSWSVSSTRATLYDPEASNDAPHRALTQRHLQARVVRPEEIKALLLPTGSHVQPSIKRELKVERLVVRHMIEAVGAVYEADYGLVRSLCSRDVNHYDFITCANTGAHNLNFRRLTPCSAPERAGEVYVTTGSLPEDYEPGCEPIDEW